MTNFPKVLIVSRGVWDDAKGTSSTLSNLFQDYDSDRVAQIYIESMMPNTACCHRFFQISEISLIKKMFQWKLVTGHAIDTTKTKSNPVSDKIVKQESGAMSFVRRHRSSFFSFLREILWMFNGWRSKELQQFILKYKPDVIWIDGSPLPLMYRLFDYVISVANKPASIFMQDDVYTYESCSGLFCKMRKLNLRKHVMRTVKTCKNMFVASPKMKREYDKIFGVNSIFIAKSISKENLINEPDPVHHPIRMVYMGQVIYGRIYTLIAISNAIKEINKDGTLVQLYIYTNNSIPEDLKQQLLIDESVFLMNPVPYCDVPRMISQNDILVFVESFNPRYCNVARLSFSTKICDYLASGKCIVAIGPPDSAPIEYFQEEDAAIIVTSPSGISDAMAKITNISTVEKYAENAHRCADKNHDREEMNHKIFDTLRLMSNDM